MLDLDLVEEPTHTGIDIVGVAEMKRHLRVSNSKMDDIVTSAINDAADMLHGVDGKLNRTVFPTTWRRYYSSWPASGIMRLPYPPLIEVMGVTFGGGSPPDSLTEGVDYTVRTVNMIPEIVLLRTPPQVPAGPRAIAVTYRAGYVTYPLKVKRAVKFLAAHFFENAEATINEPRQMAVNRKVEFGLDWIFADLKVPNSYDQWDD